MGILGGGGEGFSIGAFMVFVFCVFSDSVSDTGLKRLNIWFVEESLSLGIVFFCAVCI